MESKVIVPYSRIHELTQDPNLRMGQGVVNDYLSHLHPSKTQTLFYCSNDRFWEVCTELIEVDYRK
jgi:hypothetical protein